jgi:CRISPR-associated protein Cmr2
MVHDYYLSGAYIENKLDKQKVELGKKKKEMLKKISEGKNFSQFYPSEHDLEYLPQNSVLIKIPFTLKKPYTSKDEGEFHIVYNQIVRDKFTGLPVVRPSTWKGHLRFAAEMVEKDEAEKKKIIRRIFGSKPDENKALKGRLYFFPTFFETEPARDVITPLQRSTRTPASGPIDLEVIKPKNKGELYLLYFPYPKGEGYKEEEVEEDLKFLAKALELMLYTYGFSAKKTAGFGVVDPIDEDKMEVVPENFKEYFSVIYRSHDVTEGGA